MQRVSVWFAGMMSLCFMVMVLLCAVDFACFDVSFYDSEYRKLDTARSIGMKHSALMEVTDGLLGYTRDKTDELDVRAEINDRERDVFDERDTLHMVDVKALYLNAMTVRNILIPTVIVLGIAAFFTARKGRLRQFAKGYIAGGVVFAVFVGALATWAAVDFNSFWTSFHRLFFTNDLWLLDPAKSVLVNMVPAQFFFDLVMRIIGIFALIAGIPLVLSITYTGYHRYRRHALLAIAEEDEGNKLE